VPAITKRGANAGFLATKEKIPMVSSEEEEKKDGVFV
jgi:hypothetical protein